MQGLGSWQTLDTSMGRWYRSKETISGKNPNFGYLANKRWPLNEAITLHLMYFAQVQTRNKSINVLLDDFKILI